MHTIKLNVYAEHRKWLELHSKADQIIFNDKREVVQVVYKSPLEQWRGMIDPDGTVSVPDMEYYNSLRSPLLIEDALDELLLRGDKKP